jgi:hypothetical protein
VAARFNGAERHRRRVAKVAALECGAHATGRALARGPS